MGNKRGRPTLTLEQLVERGTFRPERHGHLIPDKQPEWCEWSDWLRLLRRVGRSKEAGRLVVERVRAQAKGPFRIG